MQIISNIIDFIVHLDKNVIEIVSYLGIWSYVFIFLVIFAETGLVFIPFLPGDSLLFIIGTIASTNSLNFLIILILLNIAAVIGDTVNYNIGKFFGKKIIESKKIKFINETHFEKANKFYEKHGGKTIIIARFIPIIRTFAPFVAGMAEMSYKKFIAYNIIGGISWVTLFLSAGYFFGNIPVVKENLSLLLMIIIFISILPGIIAYIRSKLK